MNLEDITIVDKAKVLKELIDRMEEDLVFKYAIVDIKRKVFGEKINFDRDKDAELFIKESKSLLVEIHDMFVSGRINTLSYDERKETIMDYHQRLNGKLSRFYECTQEQTSPGR